MNCPACYQPVTYEGFTAVGCDTRGCVNGPDPVQAGQILCLADVGKRVRVCDTNSPRLGLVGSIAGVSTNPDFVSVESDGWRFLFKPHELEVVAMSVNQALDQNFRRLIQSLSQDPVK